MKKILRNKKFFQTEYDNDDTLFIPVCKWKKLKNIDPSVSIKCGDCKIELIIYYNKKESYMQIGGVVASNNWWKELFKEIGLIDKEK